MTDSLAAGLSTTRRVDVDTDKTIGFMGDDLRVYATPALVADMEITCRDFLLEHVGENDDSVGTRVEIDHMAPTLNGMWVEITVEVDQVKGRAVSFTFTARDAVEQVAKGKHWRFVVDKDQTAKRLAGKRAKAAESA